MNKKQILIDQKIITYYQWSTPLDTNYSLEVCVFLHGWMQDGTSFKEIFEILDKKNIPYISLDLPWFWWSQLQHDNMNLDDYSNVVRATIEKLELKKPILLWHSFWWRICINLGSSYENIEKIVLICAAWVQRKIPLHWYIIIKTGKIVLSLPGLSKIWSYFREGLRSPDMKNAGRMTKIFKNTIAQDIQDKMILVNYKTLMIWWEDDDQTPVSDAKIIHKLIKNSELYILSWSHFIYQEKPKEVSNYILEFINS